MSLRINNLTGHLITCDYRKNINRALNGVKPHCRVIVNTGLSCGRTCSNQACLDHLGHGRCIGPRGHWAVECARRRTWDPHLSRCANKIADSKGLSKNDRKGINPKTIFRILGIVPGNNHISVARCKETKAREARLKALAVKKRNVDNKKIIDLTSNDVAADNITTAADIESSNKDSNETSNEDFNEDSNEDSNETSNEDSNEYSTDSSTEYLEDTGPSCDKIKEIEERKKLLNAFAEKLRTKRDRSPSPSTKRKRLKIQTNRYHDYMTI